MYNYNIPELLKTTEAAATNPVERYGIAVFADCDPDWSGSNIYIDPLDTEGIAIFREFAARMAAHYKTLKTKP